LSAGGAAAARRGHRGRRVAHFGHLTLTGGAIGQGPPTAVGAAVACPARRVINLQADGSGLYTAQALWTQAREQLAVTTVVCANHAYNILKLELARQKPRHGGKGALVDRLTNLQQPSIDWVKLAGGYGVPAVAVSTAEDFAREFGSALQADGPHVIVAML
jgi:acetolactate synthase-1/2/3 large subunit